MLPQSGELEICLDRVVSTFYRFPRKGHRPGARERNCLWRGDEKHSAGASSSLLMISRKPWHRHIRGPSTFFFPPIRCGISRNFPVDDGAPWVCGPIVSSHHAPAQVPAQPVCGERAVAWSGRRAWGTVERDVGRPLSRAGFETALCSVPSFEILADGGCLLGGPRTWEARPL